MTGRFLNCDKPPQFRVFPKKYKEEIMRDKKRYSLWKCTDYKNGVKDNFENAYFLDDEVVELLNTQHEENQQLRKIITNQSVIIRELYSKLLEYQFNENPKIILTKEDLKTMDESLSYYTHGRCGE